MTQKQRLVHFGDIASANTEVETYISTNASTKNDIDTSIDNNYNVNIHTDINHNINVSQLLEKIASRTSKPKKIQLSIYLSEDTSKKFDHYGKKLGKGAKSDLIEDFLREALRDF